MGKKKGWSDAPAASFNNPFAALRGGDAPPSEPPPPADASPAPATAESPPRRAVVRLERKGRGGKKVTVITHLGLDDERLARWLRDLRKQLGCGGSVEGVEIVLQGDQRDAAANALEQMGVRKVTRG